MSVNLKAMSSSKPVTHLLIRSRQAVPNTSVPMDVVQGYRASDGLRIITVKDALVQFGEDPQNGGMRVFIDHDHAVAFARVLMDRDWAVQCGLDPKSQDFVEQVKREFAANIRDEDAEKRIISPDNNRVLSLKN